MRARHVALILCACPLATLAQDAGPPPATVPVAEAPAEPPPPVDEGPQQPGATQLDTIEVTATRRKERLLEVPVAVTAITEDQVEVRGITRLDDLNSLAPGLQVSRSPSNTTISQITLRGSSQINPALYWDPAVGVYLDGVYIGKSQGAIFDIVDLAGVEVLRGPQGTLYGRNTIGGTINFITREPTGSFSGSGAVELGSYNDRIARASMDLPRLGVADLTLGVRSERRDGWVEGGPDSLVPELNNRHNDGLHAAARLDLLPQLVALYRFDANEVDQANNFDQLYRMDDPSMAQYVHQDRQTTAEVNSPSFERFDLQGHALTLTWDLGDDNAIKSITGYRQVTWADSLDLDGSPRFVAFTQRFTDYEQQSQDLNLTGEAGAWKYVAGVYYFGDDGFTNNPQHFYENALEFDSRYGTHTQAWAGYGQVDWSPFAPLTLTAGLRYTREKKRLDRVLGVRSVPSPDLPGLPPVIPPADTPFVYYMPEGYTTPWATFTATTPLATVAWQWSPNLNTYLRYAEGFKSGGYNGEFSSLTATPEENQAETRTPFRPEKQKSLELGLKASFFAGRATAHIAAFHNKLIDLQIPTFTGGGAAATVVRNAGKGTVKGLEIETALVPLEGTTLRANYALLDAKYDEFLEADENVADDRAFVHAPRVSWNVVLDSTLLDGGWGALRAVADYVWTDSFYTYPYQLGKNPDSQKQFAEDSKVAAYGLLNARLAWTSIPVRGTATAELALWGRNLMDDATPNNFIDFGPALFNSLTVVNFVEPRTVGVAAILRW